MHLLSTMIKYCFSSSLAAPTYLIFLYSLYTFHSCLEVVIKTQEDWGKAAPTTAQESTLLGYGTKRQIIFKRFSLLVINYYLLSHCRWICTDQLVFKTYLSFKNQWQCVLPKFQRLFVSLFVSLSCFVLCDTSFSKLVISDPAQRKM